MCWVWGRKCSFFLVHSRFCCTLWFCMMILRLLSLQRGKTLKGTVAFNYVMKPAAAGTLILEATATELIQFSPLNILNGAAQMEAKYVVQMKKRNQWKYGKHCFTRNTNGKHLYIHRQTLRFLEIMKTPLLPPRADYLPRGSLQYEFGSELLQTPIQLLKISNAEAQVAETNFPLIQSFVELFCRKKSDTANTFLLKDCWGPEPPGDL